MNVAVARTSQITAPNPQPLLVLQDAATQITKIMGIVSSIIPSAGNLRNPDPIWVISDLDSRIAAGTSVYNGNSITDSGSVSMSMNSKSLLKLRSFLDYPDNWNGYGAKRFTEGYVKSIETIISKLSFETRVFPISDGRVQLEFDKENGAYLEIEINPNDTVKVFEILPDGSELEYKDKSENVVRIVSSFYE